MPCPPQQQPAQQPPPVQRLRLRYAKRGRLRFTSHRDIGRAFERAVRRARLPVAYSSGFNPHPRLSYAGAAPTGASSEAEYMEIALAAQRDPDEVRRALDAAMPPGLDVVDAVTARGGALADRLQASRWEVRLSGVDTREAQAAVRAFLGAGIVEVSRMTKRGLRSFDARSVVVELAAACGGVDAGAGSGAGSGAGAGTCAGSGAGTAAAIGERGAACAILQMVVRHREPSVRPDDVLAGLREVAGLEAGAAPFVQRLAQGPLDLADGTVGDPLAPDRDTHHA